MLGDHLECGGFLAQHHINHYVAQNEYSFEDDVEATNAFLDELAMRKPTNTQQLLAVKGCGPRKVELYGEEILQVLISHGILPQVENSPIADNTASISELTKEPVPDREEIIAKYPRAFQRWQPEEDAQLLQLFQDKMYLSKTCETLGRQPSAVWARLVILLSPDMSQD